MSVSLSNAVLMNLGLSVSDSGYYGAGTLNAGDLVNGYTVSQDALWNYDTLDRFLESVTGGKIDFVQYAGTLKYAVSRISNQVRVSDGYGNSLANNTPYTYAAPNSSYHYQLYSNRLSRCGWDSYCTSSVTSQYSDLNSSASLYSSSYSSFKYAFDSLLNDWSVTSWDIDSYLSKCRDYQAKQSAYVMALAQLEGSSGPSPQVPVPVPVPVPSPVPQVPVPVPYPLPPTQTPSPSYPPLPPTQTPGSSGGSNSDND